MELMNQSCTNISLLDTTRVEDLQNENWYPDSGATHHVTNNLQNLNLDNKEYQGMHSISMDNGTCINITHRGQAQIKSHRILYLNNLLRVPKIKKNLISVSQFAQDNDVFFEFYPNHWLVRDIQTK